jgi:poly(A) polymerase
MAVLGLKPGPVVGRAYKFLLEERMEHGPLQPEDAEARLLAWWAQQPEAVPPVPEADESRADVELSATEESK